jgi:ankyrin repeat protein
MKHIFLVLLTISSLVLRAQQNTLLDQSFWKTNPDIAAVMAAIEKGSSPSEANRMGNDPMVMAINAPASLEVIKFLLDQQGNNVNKLTHDARTYIFWAVSRGNTEVVEYLLSKGAKVNVEDSHSMTPISFAASTGQTNTKLYDALLKAGADIKQKNPDGASLLLLAIGNDKDLALTNYFIAKGLSLKDTDAAGNTAFNYVARTGNINLMKTLIEKGVVPTDNAMIMAAQGARGASNGIEVFQYLESLNIKPAVVNKNGENALHNIARKANQQEITRYFLSKGANADQPDNDGNTPFMIAASFNRDTAAVSLFLSQVKNINQVNKKGQSALTMAVRNNSPEVVQFLISKAANVNVYDAEGNNLAYYLIQSYTPQAGAPGFNGGTPQVANSNGQPVASAQASAASRPATAGNAPEAPNRQGAPEGGNRGGGQRADGFGPKMKILQEAGFNLATAQKDGNTLYHLAIMKNDLSLLKRIENLKVDVNAKNKEGLTPLQKAAMIAKDDTILKYLLSIGAKKDIATEFKETAYDMAKENEFLSKNNIPVDFLK